VLSFAFHDNQGIKPILLGEIFINFQQVKWQAQDTYEQEITLLFIHGVLHLLGYNHDNLKKAKLMQNLQNNILKQLNFVA
jgi:probable rRNA maturation factor